MVIFVLSEISEEASRRPLFRYSSTTTRSAYSAPFANALGRAHTCFRKVGTVGTSMLGGTFTPSFLFHNLPDWICD